MNSKEETPSVLNELKDERIKKAAMETIREYPKSFVAIAEDDGPSGALPPLKSIFGYVSHLDYAHRPVFKNSYTQESVDVREAALKQRLELWEQLLHPTNGVNRIAWIREQIRQTKEELDGGRK